MKYDRWNLNVKPKQKRRRIFLFLRRKIPILQNPTIGEPEMYISVKIKPRFNSSKLKHAAAVITLISHLGLSLDNPHKVKKILNEPHKFIAMETTGCSMVDVK